MKPKSQPSQSQKFLFEHSLEEICYPKNPLFVLANQIDWKRFDDEFKPFYCESYGRPAKPTRLMVALHYLKYTFNLSDQETLDRWVENPYWQYFTGECVFQNEYPTDPSNMTRWRKRIGEERIKILFAETI
ncbi:MAG: transposase, partial [Planctomycetia bacterium]|nr:transposase [Planctomycetia bacterium]